MDRHDAAEVFRLAARVAVARLSGGHTMGGVAVLLNPRGEVLLTLARYRNSWSFPGGYFEPGETGPQGITRELVEEIGYAPMDRSSASFAPRLDEPTANTSGSPCWTRIRRTASTQPVGKSAGCGGAVRIRCPRCTPSPDRSYPTPRVSSLSMKVAGSLGHVHM